MAKVAFFFLLILVLVRKRRTKSKTDCAYASKAPAKLLMLDHVHKIPPACLTAAAHLIYADGHKHGG